MVAAFASTVSNLEDPFPPPCNSVAHLVHERLRGSPPPRQGESAPGDATPSADPTLLRALSRSQGRLTAGAPSAVSPSNQHGPATSASGLARAPDATLLRAMSGSPRTFRPGALVALPPAPGSAYSIAGPYDGDVASAAAPPADLYSLDRLAQAPPPPLARASGGGTESPQQRAVSQASAIVRALMAAVTPEAVGPDAAAANSRAAMAADVAAALMEAIGGGGGGGGSGAMPPSGYEDAEASNPPPPPPPPPPQYYDSPSSPSRNPLPPFASMTPPAGGSMAHAELKAAHVVAEERLSAALSARLDAEVRLQVG